MAGLFKTNSSSSNFFRKRGWQRSDPHRLPCFIYDILSLIYHHIAIALLSGNRPLPQVILQALYLWKTSPDPIKTDLLCKILHSFNPLLLVLGFRPAVVVFSLLDSSLFPPSLPEEKWNLYLIKYFFYFLVMYRYCLEIQYWFFLKKHFILFQSFSRSKRESVGPSALSSLLNLENDPIGSFGPKSVIFWLCST